MGLYASFGLTTYKAFDYRGRFLNAEAVKDVLHGKIDEQRSENEALTATYQRVLLNLSLDNYQMNDIKLPLAYMIFDQQDDVFRMLKFNKAYEDIYGDDPANYFAKTNEEVKGNIGAEWERNNKIALREEKIHFFEEGFVTKEGVIGKGTFAKWIVRKQSGIYLYMLQTKL